METISQQMETTKDLLVECVHHPGKCNQHGGCLEAEEEIAETKARVG
jgi:hypothetical protein